MNDSADLLKQFLAALAGGDLWTMILKLALGLGLIGVWFIWTGKLKKAQNDAANAATNQLQGGQMADTQKDTQDIAGDANAAADKIDQFHRRQP